MRNLLGCEPSFSEIGVILELHRARAVKLSSVVLARRAELSAALDSSHQTMAHHSIVVDAIRSLEQLRSELDTIATWTPS
jgi:hypothetical protein